MNTTYWMVTVGTLLAICGSAAGADPAEPLKEINSKLQSIQVVGVDAAGSLAYYLPSRAEVIGEDDKAGKFTVTSAGGQKSVSGIVILRANPDEVKTASKLLKDKLGDKYELKAITVDTFESWVKVKGKTVWHQSEGDGPVKRLVIDALIPNDTAEIVLVTAAYTTERRKIQGVKVRIDWRGVETALRQRVQKDNPILGEAKLEALVNDLLKSDAVKIETSLERKDETNRQIKELLTAEIQKRLLDQDEPRSEDGGKDNAKEEPEKKERGYYFSYRVKKEADLKGGVETLDLNEVREIRKRELIVVKLPL